MDEETREARRRRLAEQVAALKRGETAPATAPAADDEEDDDADDDDELDWDLEPGSSTEAEGDEASTGRTSTLDASAPDLGSLDSGWDEDDDDEEEEEEPEPELPDEQRDPVAYALAKQALEERREARRQKKREKDAAKKARRKARALQLKGKQKAKKVRASRPAPVPKPKKKRAAPKPLPKSEGALDASREERVLEETDERAAPTRRLPKKQSQTNVLVLVGVLIVFAGAVAYALLHK